MQCDRKTIRYPRDVETVQRRKDGYSEQRHCRDTFKIGVSRHQNSNHRQAQNKDLVQDGCAKQDTYNNHLADEHRCTYPHCNRSRQPTMGKIQSQVTGKAEDICEVDRQCL